MAERETMKARDLIGRRVRLVVHETPCRVVMTGCAVLTETTDGTIERLIRMPCGPIGVLRLDDGSRIAFDAGADVSLRKIEIEVPAEGAPAPTGEAPPIPMLLFCPVCHAQHVDEPDERTPGWTNPPHRSHLCHGCGAIFRPADVPTVGVAKIATRGKADTWPAPAPPTICGEMEDGA